MGCEQSVPVQQPLSSSIGKTERRPREGLKEQDTRDAPVQRSMGVKRQSEVVNMNGSNASKAASSTVSLEVDEFITDELPKVDHLGHLMPEEVVRRTSSSLSVSSIRLGNKSKCRTELQLTVSAGVMVFFFARILF